jgi:hypothetical protein
MSGNRTIVDNSAAARVLRLHDAHGLSGAEEHAVEVDVDHLTPSLIVEVLNRTASLIAAGVIEEEIQTSELLDCECEEVRDLRLVGDVRRYRPDAIASV